MSNFPNYYLILEIPETATTEDIREAYKKQALLTHPDRLPENASAQQRRAATERFQLIADAYHVLVDRTRRRQYDEARSGSRASAEREAFMESHERTDANDVFGGVFEELLRPEVEHPTVIWQVLGAGAGAVLGFILANVGGAVAGGVAGRYLGRVRDRKGVSVYTAFERLTGSQRREILTALLTRFVAHLSTGAASGSMKY
ncbi:DnaJ domain-containing protein [Umbelopsis sp. PMI_123]|nr:DnaJ domain-containing protein [Umbelopsis sp. PMI_123]